MALRPLVIRSDTGARPVRKQTSELRTESINDSVKTTRSAIAEKA